jgi:RHS repeat-associated protein
MGSWTFAYDHLNRLLSGTPTSGVYSGQGQELCLDYDSFGNRTQSDLQTTACKPNPTPPAANVPVNPAYDPNTASYNAANQVGFTTVNAAANGFAYDAAGDVTFDGANYYAYDAEGRVCATQTAPYSGGVAAYGYLYDAEGRRVAKGSITPVPLGQLPSCDLATNGFKLTESYVLGQGGERLTALAWTGGATGTSAWQSTNVYAGGKLIATYDAGTAGQSADAGTAGGLHFQLADPLGTRRVQANSAGEAELDCQSLPFGDQLSCFPDPNAPGNDQDEDATGMLTGIHFTGKERDTGSGLDYFGARMYASTMGRFLSPDHAEDETIPVALPFAELTNPQTLNLYSYVQNNPLSNVDPDGHATWGACADGSGSQCLFGDFNGEANQQNGRTVYWNSAAGNWDNNDPTKMNDGRINDLSGGQLLMAAPMGRLLEPIMGKVGEMLTSALGKTGETAASGASQVVVSGSKSAVRDALNSGAISDAQKGAVKRALARGKMTDTFTVEKLGDGSVKVTQDVAGRAGGHATYEKIVDASGNTVPGSVVQRGYMPSGEEVHTDPKY